MFDRFKRKKTPEQLVTLALENLSAISILIDENLVQQQEQNVKDLDDGGREDKTGNGVYFSQSSFCSLEDENEMIANFNGHLGPVEEDTMKGEGGGQNRNGEPIMEKRNSKLVKRLTFKFNKRLNE